MKTLKRYSKVTLLLTGLLLLGFTACNSSQYGKKVKEPFSGNSYESNNKWFRAVGKGVSIKDNIAKSKADMEAKTILAGQLNTSIKKVTDQYLGQTENESNADIADKFQSLAREVMNTNMADLRKIGEEKFFDNEKYTVFIAYEIKKNAMFRFLKKQAKTSSKLNNFERKEIEDLIDKEIKQLDALD
jgi:hypothetical protein